MSKILIVEDEDAIRRVLKKVLIEESSKYIIDEAINGDQAISLIKTNNYDLVFFVDQSNLSLHLHQKLKMVLMF